MIFLPGIRETVAIPNSAALTRAGSGGRHEVPACYSEDLFHASIHGLGPVFSVLVIDVGNINQGTSRSLCKTGYLQWENYPRTATQQGQQAAVRNACARLPSLSDRVETWTIVETWLPWLSHQPSWVTDNSSPVLSNLTGTLISTICSSPEEKFFLWNCCSPLCFSCCYLTKLGFQALSKIKR